MTPEQRQQIETQIQSDFSELQKKLENLKNEVQTESDESKKQGKNEEIQILETELAEIKSKMDTLSELHEEEVLALKTRLEEYRAYKQEILDIRKVTPTTYELLKDSATIRGIEGDSKHPGLLKIIESNPKEFKNLPGDTAEKKLEYIFEKIRNSIVLFMKNKLGDSTTTEYVINNTIAPAFEWSLMELLRDQGNEANVGMLQGINEISRKGNMFLSGFNRLLNGVSDFSEKATGSYNKFSQWMNAVDYLAVHNGVLRNPNKSEVLSNPLKFQEYMNNEVFAPKKDEKGIITAFSPYCKIDGNIFKVDENQDFEFGISSQEKDIILQRIGTIQVVNNPRTTSLIVKMLDKPEQFLEKTQGLQKTANAFLNGVNSLNSVTKIFGVDILGDITKSPNERHPLYKILDFVCKLIGITGGLEGIVKRWRLERMNLTDGKNENISQIFEKYKELAGENKPLNITDEASCKTALADFAINDIDHPSTKGDFLCKSMIENMDVSLVSPGVVEQILGRSHLKKQTIKERGKTKETYVVDESTITDADKAKLAQGHLGIMKSYLENYKNNDLSVFYTNINSTEDIALCITASLYADKNDVIEGVKANVFLPENYGSVRMDGTVVESGGRENLDSAEFSDKQKVSEQWIYDKAVEYGITDNRQIAYVLSTIKGESGFKNQKEIGGENKDYGKIDSITGKAYYGRGFIQITHKSNYEKYTEIIKNSGKDFKDNDGNTLKGSEIDLVNNPDVILQSNDLAAFIAMDRMKNGGPDRLETKKLSYYINDTKTDYYNARIIINGMSSKPQEYADNALAYQNKLGNGSVDSPIESKDSIFSGPKLLAHNKDEIGGLGNSIMVGFQGYKNKLNFPNMDGEESKNTQNHPNRFNSLLDVQGYKAEHPSVKSFMFYFGANTKDNNQTVSDIKKWAMWFKEEGIQPVLCTCIGEDRHTWLTSLNQSIRDLGKEKDWPIFDFAKQYNEGDISMGGEGHPTSQGYSTMAGAITEQLQA